MGLLNKNTVVYGEQKGILSWGPSRAAKVGQKYTVLYRHDKPNEPTKEGPRSYTVIRFLWVNANFSTCTVESVNGTLDEDKMRRFKGDCAHFSFNKGPTLTTVKVQQI